MRKALALAWIYSSAAVGLAAAASPNASGLDCAKAGSAMERRICADPKLGTAEAEMSAAYFALLRSVKDRGMRDALVMSQRRWIAARQDGLGDYGSDSDPDTADEGDWPVPLIDAIRQRRDRLAGRGPGGEAAMVSTMRRERALLARAPGGAFHGFLAECFFPHRRYAGGVVCAGSMLLQKAARVCGSVSEWATGTTYDTAAVADVVGGSLRFKAYCRLGGGCPDGSEGAFPARKPDDGLDAPNGSSGWTRNPRPGDVGLPRGPVHPLDPDIAIGEAFDDAGLRQCLDDPTYPDPPSPAVPAPGTAPPPPLHPSLPE